MSSKTRYYVRRTTRATSSHHLGTLVCDHKPGHPKSSILTISFSFLVAIHHAKVEIRLIKKDPTLHWGTIGTMLPGNDEMTAKINRGLQLDTRGVKTYLSKKCTIDLMCK